LQQERQPLFFCLYKNSPIPSKRKRARPVHNLQYSGPIKEAAGMFNFGLFPQQFNKMIPGNSNIPDNCLHSTTRNFFSPMNRHRNPSAIGMFELRVTANLMKLHKSKLEQNLYQLIGFYRGKFWHENLAA
jgi:hypothetical protein